MVSLRRHFVPNPVSPSRTNPTPNCQPSLFGHTWYDGLNRRTIEVPHYAAATYYLHQFYNSSWQRLEMRPDLTTGNPPEQLQPYCQHVWSARYIDSPVLWDRDADNDSETGDLGKSGSGLEERLYYLGDANFNVTTLVNTSGEAVEHYQYDPYGRVKVLNGAAPDTDGDEWTDDPYNNTDVANVILYTGREYDSIICLYQYRHRYYHAELGRFLSRDPIGYWVGDANLYRYVGNRPTNVTDPAGLSEWEWPWSGNASWNIVDTVSLWASAEAKVLGFVGTPSDLGLPLAPLPPPLSYLSEGASQAAALASRASQAGSNARVAGHSTACAAYEMVGLPLADLTGVTNTTYFWESDDPLTAEEYSFGSRMARGGVGVVQLGTIAYVGAKGFTVLRIPKGNIILAEVVPESAAAPSGWSNLAGGVRIKKVGNYWVKEVNPNAGWVARWWGRGSLNAQARGLSRLGDMAPSHLYRNGRLVTRDVGRFVGSRADLCRIWVRGSCRLRTPFNDIRPRNIGANGEVFDPSFHSIHEGVYWTGAGIGVGGGGTWLYYNGQTYYYEAQSQ